jgi:adenine-specific DNA-methyltransferase
MPVPTFYHSRNTANAQLERVLGEKRFPFPKDHEVLMRWLRMACPPDGLILDFFGGSGTTTEAVLRLNAEDGGTRQSILVTNNEVGSKQAKAMRKAGHHPGDPEWEAMGVFEYVTRPRISTVVTGKRPDGSPYSDGLSANVELLQMNYLDPGMVRRGREFAAIAPLLWLEAGATGDRIAEEPNSGWALTEHYGILFTVDAMAPFAAAAIAAAQADRAPRVAFIITDSPTEFQAAAERLPAGIDTIRLYESYLANYTINVPGGAR